MLIIAKCWPYSELWLNADHALSRCTSDNAFFYTVIDKIVQTLHVCEKRRESRKWSMTYKNAIKIISSVASESSDFLLPTKTLSWHYYWNNDNGIIIIIIMTLLSARSSVFKSIRFTKKIIFNKESLYPNAT